MFRFDRRINVSTQDNLGYKGGRICDLGLGFGIRIRIHSPRGIPKNESNSLSLDEVNESLDSKSLVTFLRKVKRGQMYCGFLNVVHRLL